MESQTILKVQKFPTHATRPNLIIEPDMGKGDNHSNISSVQTEEQNYENPLDAPVFRERWVLDDGNPGNIVMSFSHLYIKKGYKLRSYIFMSDLGSNGIVFAIPEDQELSPPEHYDSKELIVPVGTLQNIMEAIEGDRTPLSYLQAAIVYHKLNEYGASWHGSDWSYHRILPLEEAEKWKLEHEQNSDMKIEWNMLEPEPDIWEPHFYCSEIGEPVVVFYTTSPIGSYQINKFVHTFSIENYTLTVNRQCIATGGGGIIF